MCARTWDATFTIGRISPNARSLRPRDMRGIFVSLRTGDWITRERMRLWLLGLLVASVVGIVFLLTTSDGLNDFQGRPLGTDFSNVYAGGTYVLDGKPGAAFDPASQYARQKLIFGHETQFYGWHYP